MISNKKVTGTAVSFPVGISSGLAVSIIITMCLAALEAWLTLSGRVEEWGNGYMIIANLFASSFVGALLSAARIKRRRMMVCLIEGGAYYLTLLVSTALFFGGKYQGVGVGAAVVLAGTGLAGMICVFSKGTGAKKYKRYASC